MKPIIAPTDFSSVSLHAVNYAADMASLLGLKLILFHVYGIPVPVSEVPVPAATIGEIEDEANRRMEKLRDQLLVRTSGKINIHTVLRPGNVLHEIITLCNEVKPHAVIMGAETAAATERLFFGGITVESLKKMEYPLVVVPPCALLKQICKIGFACDFRDVVETVRVKEIKEFVEEFKAELHVLHISDSPFSPGKLDEYEWLKEILAGLAPHYHFLKGNNIETQLAEFAEKNKLDLLIIIPRRHSFISGLFQHRHSKRLVLQTHIPILALHE